MSTSLPPKPRVISSQRNRIAIVASKYNEQYSDALVDFVIDELGEYLPQARVDLIRVPGAFEIPVTVRTIVELEAPTCVIALGVILQGETEHANLVAGSVTEALMTLAMQYHTPVIHEVLLLENEEQARQRCLDEKLNRGIEAARAAATMVEVFHELDRGKKLRMKRNV